MQHQISGFANSGELSGAIIPQLTHALEQAQHQFDLGHQDQAVKQIQDFIKHLNN